MSRVKKGVPTGRFPNSQASHSSSGWTGGTRPRAPPTFLRVAPPRPHGSAATAETQIHQGRFSHPTEPAKQVCSWRATFVLTPSCSQGSGSPEERDLTSGETWRAEERSRVLDASVSMATRCAPSSRVPVRAPPPSGAFLREKNFPPNLGLLAPGVTCAGGSRSLSFHSGALQYQPHPTLSSPLPTLIQTTQKHKLLINLKQKKILRPNCSIKGNCKETICNKVCISICTDVSGCPRRGRESPDHEVLSYLELHG